MSNEITEGHTFTWKIENFSLCSQETGDFMLSPPFTTENVGDIIWILSLFPRGESEEFEEYISLCLNRFKGDTHTEEANVDVELKIIGSEREILQRVKGENLFISEENAWGSKNFFARDRMEKWKEDAITISCSIFNRRRLCSTAKTKIYADHYSFKWDVAIPGNMNIEKQQVHETPLFKINVATFEDNIKLSIRKRENVTMLPERVSCRISLLNMQEFEVDSKRAAHSFLPDEIDAVWEFPDFLTAGYLKENASTVLNNGTFTLLFNFSFSKEKEPINILIPDGNNYPKLNNIIRLKENLRNMYVNRLHSDVEFQVYGRTFHAHKSILAAQSPVFSAMLNQDVLENQTGVVNIDISSIEPDIFELFLEYIYTSTVDIMDWKTACKLLIAADRCQVEALRIDSSSFLKSNLNNQNFYDVLELSDMINYHHLKECVFNFVAENAEEILTSSEWMDWAENNATLSEEVMSNIPNTSENIP